MRKGFSFVELILILVFFFIILASLMPMITRRHLAPPSRVDHGTYACYRDRYNPNILRETLVKGKRTIIDNKPAAGGKCSFRGPKKARYFYVQLIGGGGGGKELKPDDYDLEKNSAYQIKKSEVKETRFLVSQPDRGSEYSASLDIDSFFPKGYNDYNELIKDQYVILKGYSGDGSYCDPSLYGGSCEKGASKGSAAKCTWGTETHYICSQCGSNGNGCTPVEQCPDSGPMPEECYTKRRVETTYGTSYMNIIERDCTNDESLREKQYIRCDIASYKPKTYKYLDGIKPKVVPNVIDTRCPNAKYGQGVGWYNQRYKISYFGGQIYSSASNHDKCKNYYINYNSPQYTYSSTYPQKTFAFEPMGDGQGIYFYKGNDVYFAVCGGQGAAKGVPKRLNPKAFKDYGYDANIENDFCSEDAQYPQSGNGNYYTKIKSKNQYASLVSRGEGAQDNSSHNYEDLKFVKTDITQSQWLPYGVGGKAGELKTMILKEIPEGIDMLPGKGGEAGKPGEDTKLCFPNGTTQADCSNPSWPKDLVKPAKGGAAGENMYLWEININPYYNESNKTLQPTTAGEWRIGETVQAGARAGEKTKLESIIKFIISSANQTLRDLLMHFGEGGPGTAVSTKATCGADYQDIAFMNGNTEIKSKKHETRKHKLDLWKSSDGKYYCKGHQWKYVDDTQQTDGYWDGAVGVQDDGKAQAGKSGAIVISW